LYAARYFSNDARQQRELKKQEKQLQRHQEKQRQRQQIQQEKLLLQRQQEEQRKIKSTNSSFAKGLNWNKIKTKIIIGVGIWIITSAITYHFFNKTPDSSLKIGGTFSLVSLTLKFILSSDS